MFRTLLFAVWMVSFCGCSSLGLTLYPTGHFLTDQSEQVLACSPREADLPKELSKGVLPVHYLEPGDVLLIEPVDFESQIRIPADQHVLADGSVDLGGFGRAVVAGLTLEAAEDLIEQTIIHSGEEETEINIRLLEGVHRFYVLGEVNSPGAYPFEGNETVLVNLSNAVGSNVTIIDSQGSGTIVNDDSAAVTIANVSGNEDDGAITVTATLDNAVQGGFTVDLSSADGSATLADNDYSALNTTLTFAGTAGEAQTTSISPIADTNGETDETLLVSQSNLQTNSTVNSAGIAVTDTATVTLLNDDPVTLVVLNNNDSGQDSLRDVVDRAAAGDTIIFDASLAGQTITLTSGEIVLLADMTIDGSALSSQVAISGNNASRIFLVGTTRNIELNALRLIDGRSDVGGAIRVQADSSLTIVDSTFSGNTTNTAGGAIFSRDSNLVINSSLLTSNESGVLGGAAIAVSGGVLNLENSTVTGNTGSSPSAIGAEGSFIGLNSVIADNSAPFGLVLRGAPEFQLSNMILSGHSSQDLDFRDSAELTVNINNLCESCLVGGPYSVEQAPLLAPLADNGGPTLTRALFSNSPAFNAGDNAAAAGLTTDQRGVGFARVLDGTVDIGAFEGSIPAPIRPVNLNASANTGSEAAGTIITVTATANAPVVGDQSIDIDVSGTGITTSDFALSSPSITIANGQTSGTATFTVQDDALVEGDETVVVALSNPSDQLSLGNSVSQNITITDNDSATVTIDDVSGAEDGGPMTVTATLDNAVQGGFTVNLISADGSATLADSDYTAVNTILTFAGTAGEIQTVTMTPTADNIVEPNEAFTVSLSNLTPNDTNVDVSDTATVTLNNDDSGVLALAATTQGVEGSTNGLFTLSSTQVFSTAVTVNVSISGLATQGVDFSAINPTITLPALSASVTLPVQILDDALVEGVETIVLTLASTNNSSALISANTSAELIIQDDDNAELSISATTDAVEGMNDGVFTVNTTRAFAAPTAITLALSGTATEGLDYNAIGTTLLFPANALSTTLAVEVIADEVAELDESVIITLAASNNPSVTISPQSVAELTIAHPTIALELSANSVAEDAGETIVTVTVFRSNTLLSEALSVTLLSSDSSRITLPTTVVIPAEQASASAQLIVIDNDVINDDQQVTITASAQGLNDVSNTISVINNDFDTDADGLLDNLDNCPSIVNPDQADFEGDGIGDACDPDTDGDSLPNDYELANGLDPFNSLDRDADPDADGFTNLEEFEFGTDPQLPDSDVDANGIPDSVETAQNNAPFLPAILDLLLPDDA